MYIEKNMTTPEQMQEQMIELQTSMAHLELTVERLDQIVTRQDQEIQTLQRQLQLVYKQMTNQGGEEGIAPFDVHADKPPHYWTLTMTALITLVLINNALFAKHATAYQRT